MNAEAQAVAEAINASEETPDYVFPPVNLLRSGSAAAGDAREEILVNKERLEGAIRSFEMVDAMGRKVMGQENLNSDILELNVRSLAAGIYFITITTDRGTAVQRVSVTK